MCGIAGYLALDGQATDPGPLPAMLEAIRHRGPDDAGTFVEGPIAFGMRRLSVIDLHTGKQPIRDAASGTVITYNGECYNYPALREALTQHGHGFETQSDTEVVLKQYVQHGIEGLDRLNGMFAFAVWNPGARSLVLARDPVGIKPLYWWHGDWNGRPHLVWSSELRSLLRHPAVPRAICPAGLSEFLRFGFNFAPRTVCRDIRKLEPGGLLDVRGAKVRESRYAPMPFEEDPTAVEDVTPEQLGRVFGDAVESQLVADVPVGAFLSGGIDSSGIVALMKARGVEQIRTFSIGFQGADAFHDESRFASEFAASLGTEHHVLKVDASALARLPELATNLDEPLADSSILVSYLISELARQHVTVALSGVGGDEAFGGYRRYLGYTFDRWFGTPLIGPAARGAIRAGTALLPKTRDSKLGNLARLAHRYTSATQGDALERYLGLVSMASQDSLKALFPGYAVPQPQAVDAVGALPFSDSLRRMVALDMRGSMPEQLLNLTDRMSMAVSLEVRVPYLDLDVLRCAARIPSARKIRGRNLRVIQKEALRPLLGDEILTHKKRGFGFPLGAWIRDPASGVVEEFLSRPVVERRGVLSPDAIDAVVADHRAEKVDATDLLTALIFFEIWARSTLDAP
ncbi:MAG: asparagine synthase (glutamine-hydrolyzing) [Planctomycetota bacterium]